MYALSMKIWGSEGHMFETRCQLGVNIVESMGGGGRLAQWIAYLLLAQRTRGPRFDYRRSQDFSSLGIFLMS